MNKEMKQRLRAITLPGAIEKSPIHKIFSILGFPSE